MNFSDVVIEYPWLPYVVLAVLSFLIGRMSVKGSRAGTSVDRSVEPSGIVDAHFSVDEQIPVQNLRPVGQDALVPEEESDTFEGWFYDATHPRRVSAHLKIEYRDAKGAVTTRLVRVREFDATSGNGLMLCLCELRNANRTFRYDRIVSCVDLETGEYIENVGAYLNSIYEKSPDRATDLLASDYLDVLKVLLYVAKADGQFRKDEKEIVATYTGQLVGDERITVDLVNDVMSDIAVPSLQGFKIAVGKALRSGQVNPAKLLQCCQDIVDTQRSVHPNEAEALSYVQRKSAEIASTVV